MERGRVRAEIRVDEKPYTLHAGGVHRLLRQGPRIRKRSQQEAQAQRRRARGLHAHHRSDRAAAHDAGHHHRRAGRVPACFGRGWRGGRGAHAASAHGVRGVPDFAERRRLPADVEQRARRASLGGQPHDAAVHARVQSLHPRAARALLRQRWVLSRPCRRHRH